MAKDHTFSMIFFANLPYEEQNIIILYQLVTKHSKACGSCVRRIKTLRIQEIDHLVGRQVPHLDCVIHGGYQTIGVQDHVINTPVIFCVQFS